MDQDQTQIPQKAPTVLGATPLFARLCCNCQHYDASGWGRKLGYPVCLRTMEMSMEENAADLVHGGKVAISVTTCEKARENESMCGKKAKSFEEITKPVLMVPQWVFDEPECLRLSLMGGLWRRIQGYFQRANDQAHLLGGARENVNEAKKFQNHD